MGFVSNLFALTNRYEMKSGIVEYEIVGNAGSENNGEVIRGTSKLYFKDYGNLELTDEKLFKHHGWVKRGRENCF